MKIRKTKLVRKTKKWAIYKVESKLSNGRTISGYEANVRDPDDPRWQINRRTTDYKTAQQFASRFSKKTKRR